MQGPQKGRRSSVRLREKTLDLIWGGAATVAAGAGRNVLDTHEAAVAALKASGVAAPTVQQIAQAEAAALKVKVTNYQWGYAAGLVVGGVVLSSLPTRSPLWERLGNGFAMAGLYDAGAFATHTLRGSMQPASGGTATGGGARSLGGGARADLVETIPASPGAQAYTYRRRNRAA